MIGILFLTVVGCWVWASVQLTRFLLRKISSRNWRLVVAPVSFVALLILPVADEIVGGFQLRALCKKNAVFKVEAEKIRGKTVRSVVDPSNKDVEGTPIRIYFSHFSYRDAQTEEELASYTRYVAEGGWLIRTLSTDGHIKPLTFESTCDPTPSTDYGFKFAH